MAKPQNITQAIQIQSGAVVSKEIINKPLGTITLFAFDKGQGLSEHSTPFDALVIAVEGTAEITVAGVKHKVKANEMLLMPANARHAVEAIQPFKMLLIMLKSSS